MQDRRYTVECRCGYRLVLPTMEDAENVAAEHVGTGPEHSIICTRPAHFHYGGVPVIVFYADHKEPCRDEEMPSL